MLWTEDLGGGSRSGAWQGRRNLWLFAQEYRRLVLLIRVQEAISRDDGFHLKQKDLILLRSAATGPYPFTHSAGRS